MQWINLGRLDIPDGGTRSYAVNGVSILVCDSAGQLYAVENRCSHNGSALEGGRVRGFALFCPVHGARFDLRDGSTAGALTRVSIRTFAVEIHGDEIHVAAPEEVE